MTRDEIIKGLEKIVGFFKALAGMAVGDGKMLLMNCVRCAQEAAELIAAQKAEGERETTSSVSAGGADTFPRGEGSGEAQEPRVMTLEEAKALEQDTVVWYEHSGVRPPRPRIVHHADNVGIIFTDCGVWLFTEDNYGKKWRCWTSRPTDEQREATPWINQ